MVSIRRSISRCVSGGRFGERLCMGVIPPGGVELCMMGQHRTAGNRNLGIKGPGRKGPGAPSRSRQSARCNLQSAFDWRTTACCTCSESAAKFLSGQLQSAMRIGQFYGLSTPPYWGNTEQRREVVATVVVAVVNLLATCALRKRSHE